MAEFATNEAADRLAHSVYKIVLDSRGLLCVASHNSPFVVSRKFKTVGFGSPCSTLYLLYWYTYMPAVGRVRRLREGMDYGALPRRSRSACCTTDRFTRGEA